MYKLSHPVDYSHSSCTTCDHNIIWIILVTEAKLSNMFAKTENNPALILQSKKTSLPQVEEPKSLVNNSGDCKVNKETFCLETLDHVAPKSEADKNETISVHNTKDYRNYESNSQSSLSSTSSSLSCSYPSDKSSLSDYKSSGLTLIQNSQDQSSCEPVTNVSEVSDGKPSESYHSSPDLLSSSASGANDKLHNSPVHNVSDCHVIIQKDSPSTNENRQVLEVSTTMADLREYTRRSLERKNLAKEGRVRFRAVIEPSKNKLAEEELSREISKDMFAEVFY